MSEITRFYAIKLSLEMEYFIRTGNRFDVHCGDEWTREFLFGGQREGLKGSCRVFTARPDLQDGKGRKLAIMDDHVLISFEDVQWFFNSLQSIHLPDVETMVMAIVEKDDEAQNAYNSLDDVCPYDIEEDTFPDHAAYDEYLHQANLMAYEESFNS